MGTARYSLAEAQALLPEARLRVAEAAALVRDLRLLRARLRDAGPGMDVAERAAELEDRIDRVFGWFGDHDIAIKSLSPALLDFPARAIRDDEAIEVLLCWREDEEAIAYYHPPEDGYRGREPVGMLDHV